MLTALCIFRDATLICVHMSTTLLYYVTMFLRKRPSTALNVWKSKEFAERTTFAFIVIWWIVIAGNLGVLALTFALDNNDADKYANGLMPVVYALLHIFSVGPSSMLIRDQYLLNKFARKTGNES